MPTGVPLPRGQGSDLDRFNDALRAEPEYRAFLASLGVSPDGPLNLSGSQRTQVEQFIRQLYPQLEKGYQVDPAGNVNTDHGLSTAWSNPYFRYPLLAGGTLATMGALGAFGGAAGATGGASGAGAAGAGAASTGGGMLASSSLPVAGLMGGPAAIGSQGITAAGAGGGGFLSSLLGGIKQDPLGTLGNLGGVLGGAASGAAQGRRDDAYAEAAAGRVNLDAQAQQQRRATLLSLLGGLQDASISRPAGSTIPTFSVSGGLRPSALSNREALMTELSRPAPTVTPPVQGTGEKILGGAGLVTGILGALGRRQPYMNAGGR